MRRILKDYPAVDFYPMIDSLFAQIAPDFSDEIAKWGTEFVRTSTTQLKNDLLDQELYMYDQLTLENLPPDTVIPQIIPSGGSFADSVSVTLSGQPGWDIWYTLDGSDPRLDGVAVELREMAHVPEDLGDVVVQMRLHHVGKLEIPLRRLIFHRDGMGEKFRQ